MMMAGAECCDTVLGELLKASGSDCPRRSLRLFQRRENTRNDLDDPDKYVMVMIMMMMIDNNDGDGDSGVMINDGGSVDAE